MERSTISKAKSYLGSSHYGKLNKQLAWPVRFSRPGSVKPKNHIYLKSPTQSYKGVSGVRFIFLWCISWPENSCYRSVSACITFYWFWDISSYSNFTNTGIWSGWENTRYSIPYTNQQADWTLKRDASYVTWLLPRWPSKRSKSTTEAG